MTGRKPANSPRPRQEQTGEVNAGTGIRTYGDDSKDAVLIVRAGDSYAHGLLARVFALHRSPLSDLVKPPVLPAEAVGDCVIEEAGVTMTVGPVDAQEWNRGQRLFGVNLTCGWDATPPRWKSLASQKGYVVAMLVTEQEYRAATIASDEQRESDGWTLPSSPVLKLETVIR